MFAQVAGRFGTQACRDQARLFLAGLVSATERKNGWQLAEHAGDARPDKMQRLLNAYAWNADDVRDDLRGYVTGHLGETDGVLVVGETGFLKKGTKSVGVQRQYSETAGRIENCQLGVFLVYASTKGRAAIDRRLYLPDHAWIRDQARRAEAKVPDAVEFATKPALARAMIADAAAAGVSFAWVTGDEVYGAGPDLAGWIEQHAKGYVFAVASNRHVTTAAGRFTVADLARLVPAAGWQTFSAADGAKGPRLYDWALVATTDTPDGSDQPRQVLIRRSRDHGDLAYYLCHAPHPVPLATFVTVAGRRWRSRKCSSPGRTKSVSITTRSGCTTLGTGTSPSRCSRMPGLRSPPPPAAHPRKKGLRRRRISPPRRRIHPRNPTHRRPGDLDPADRQRDPPHPRRLPPTPPSTRTRPGLVNLATATSSDRATLPLPAPHHRPADTTTSEDQDQEEITAAVVLDAPRPPPTPRRTTATTKTRDLPTRILPGPCDNRARDFAETDLTEATAPTDVICETPAVSRTGVRSHDRRLRRH